MKTDILDFIRTELYKENINGISRIAQAEEMRISYHTLQNLHRGYFKYNPVTKFINYLIEKGGVQLCPEKKGQSGNG